MGIVQCLPLYYFTEHPIMLRNTAGEKGEYPQNSERVKSCSKRHFHPFLSVYLIKSKQGRKRNTSQPLPLCSCKEYRGSARRARGLEYKQKHKPRSFYPLSFINIQVYPHEFSTEPTTPTKTQYFHPAIERQ